ncbi:hypothetical protein RHMOL_Rhmol13G0048600 [Rhododendron molle]|uniref:Uncharacterized protein n=1 Tax=Rhododendron molle TaxID=49168 RepID=A0ACC0L4I3_RHOML|nr:hypothetical protein RHMOL_Rhmol13G0048600 [Rhododendron molle]
MNALNSSIPSELGSCSNLTYLALALNSLTGDLPLALSNQKRISELGLSGTIPSDLGKNSPSLANVSFSENNFSGELPPGLCNGLALQELTANVNGFNGSLPECLNTAQN